MDIIILLNSLTLEGTVLSLVALYALEVRKGQCLRKSALELRLVRAQLVVRELELVALELLELDVVGNFLHFQALFELV